MDGKLSILDLVKNNTLSVEMAALLWKAVSEEVSFLTSAVYREAGKSTLSKAILDLRKPETSLHYISEHSELNDKLLTLEKKGGYLVVAEFNPVELPGYIWGNKVQQVFDIAKKGYSIQGCLHAESAEETMLELTRENGINDQDAAMIKLILFVEMFGTTLSTAKRRLSSIYEVHYVENGRPMGHTLYEWDSRRDIFKKTSDPHLFATDKNFLEQMNEILQKLVEGNASDEALELAVGEYYKST